MKTSIEDITTGSKYKTDDMPVKLNFQFNDAEKNLAGKDDFINPFHEADFTDHSDNNKPYIDPVAASLKAFSQTKATPDVVTADNHFDWDKSNADRFVKSPCMTTLGFNPNMDPKQQEERFSDCENDITKEKSQNILLIISVAAFALLLVLFGIKSIKTNEIKTI